jgi:hypothetical protein
MEGAELMERYKIQQRSIILRRMRKLEMRLRKVEMKKVLLKMIKPLEMTGVMEAVVIHKVKKKQRIQMMNLLVKLKNKTLIT